VGKKKEKELLGHRSSFVEGATAKGGLPQDVAEAIFDDIEYFARYGFNKGHAVDYAVLTCQTAFLKANYRVEYMTALLCVERNNTEKVGILIGECRNTGIEVLPPDVNRSGLDFTIETSNEGYPAIRFGLGAVKNVGEGPIEVILAARNADGPFGSLDDFCRRVDLRQVNRRALESLIKVGALHEFGTRAGLLGSLDQILGLSASVHRARDVGQMSLFGEATGVKLHENPVEFSTGQNVGEVAQREVLNWEKELIGVYVSEHPLVRTLLSLRDVVNSSVETLGDEGNGQQVVIAGMVQRVRRLTTKKGADMAFVTLEGIHSTCEVVVFPRAWEKTKGIWEVERILVVSGKVDSGRREEASLLCDWVKTPDQVAMPTENSLSPHPASSPRPQPRAVQATAPYRPPLEGPDGRQTTPSQRVSGIANRNATEEPATAHRLNIVLRRTGEQSRDVQRLRAVYALLTGQPGPDHFTILLVGGDSGSIELEFPNSTTRYRPELSQDIQATLGPGWGNLELSA